MLIVVLAFALVFLIRDVQVLAAARGKTLRTQFAWYAALVLAAVAVMWGPVETQAAISHAWTQKTFALAAMLIQLGELGLALALRKWAGGRHRWIGFILPCPAFLVALFAIGSMVQHIFVRLNAPGATGIVTAGWLVLTGACVFCLREASDRTAANGDCPDDRRFVDDFALMTSCTALIFVPYGLF